MRGRVRKDKDLEENINNRFPPGAGEGANGNAAVLGKPRHLKLIFKLLIGFGAGLVASGLAMIEPLIGILFMPTMLLCVLVGLLVYGLCDSPGLAAYCLAFELASALLGGAVYALAMLLALTLPLIAMALLDKRGTPFFKRMYLSLGIEVLGLIAALAAIVLIYRQNIGDLAVKLLNDSFASFSDEAKKSLVAFYKTLYTAMGVSLSYETGDELLAAVAAMLGDSVKQGLPAMLAIFAVINVLPGVKLCSVIRIKRNIPGETSEPLSSWRLPEQYITGLLLLLVTGLILYWTIGDGGAAALDTVLTVAMLAGFIQAFASFADRFGRAPMPKGFIIALAIISVLFATRLIPIYGMLSMLVGSRGLITGIVRRHNNNRPDRDEPF